MIPSQLDWVDPTLVRDEYVVSFGFDPALELVQVAVVLRQMSWMLLLIEDQQGLDLLMDHQLLVDVHLVVHVHVLVHFAVLGQW